MQWNTLNIFQELTREWDKLHPFNAAQAMRLSHVPEADAIESAWRGALSDAGLGQVVVKGQRYRWELLNGELPQGAQLLRIEQGISFDGLLTRELNRPFEETDPVPFRPFVLDDNGARYLGVVYHHWVADSFSIRLLMRQWFYRLFLPELVRLDRIEHCDRGYWESYGPSRRNWNLAGAVLNLFRWGVKSRHARRVRRTPFSEFQTHVSLHRAPDGFMDQLMDTAKKHRVSVHDLFLAATAQVCDSLVPGNEPKIRPDLTLGSIVDLRRGEQRFGMELGFTSIYCRARHIPNPASLIQHVHAQNHLIKQTCAAESSMVRMALAIRMSRRLDRKDLLEFYRRRASMSGGVSNVNLSREWIFGHHPDPIREYVRISPCGPIMPVIFTPTTLGSQLNFALTCRKSLVPPDQSGNVAQRFIDCLSGFFET